MMSGIYKKNHRYRIENRCALLFNKENWNFNNLTAYQTL